MTGRCFAMAGHCKRSLVALVSLMAAFPCIGTGARGAVPIATRTTGGPFQHQVVQGDSFVSLGARYGIDWREIAPANGLKPGVALAPGSMLRLDNRHIVPALADEIMLVINVPQRMLFFAVSESIAGFPVALGRRDWQTPLGEFSVIAKEENPTWDVPTSIQAEMRRGVAAFGVTAAPIPKDPDNGMDR